VGNSHQEKGGLAAGSRPATVSTQLGRCSPPVAEARMASFPALGSCAGHRHNQLQLQVLEASESATTGQPLVADSCNALVISLDLCELSRICEVGLALEGLEEFAGRGEQVDVAGGGASGNQSSVRAVGDGGEVFHD